MALELEGRVVKILPPQTGEGSRGTWKKRTFVIETTEDFPKKIAFITWNDKADALDSIKTGERVRVAFSLESREFNDRWYTDARAWRITVIKEETVTPPAGGGSNYGGPQGNTTTNNDADPFASDNAPLSDSDFLSGDTDSSDIDLSADTEDDLPF